MCLCACGMCLSIHTHVHLRMNVCENVWLYEHVSVFECANRHSILKVHRNVCEG